MLTRFVRNQLIIFTIASIVGVVVMLFAYMQVPTLLGLGRLTVTLELPAAGGLYRFGNVTYRGVQIGKVTSVKLTENGAEAELSLNTSPKIPADLRADVLSVSAIGEQYVDLRPRTDSGPYLQNGSRIPVANTTIPQEVGPMLDQLSKLVETIPGDRISDLLEESFKAFNGAGPDFQSLLDSASTLTNDVNAVSDETRGLIDDSGPLLDSQAETTDQIRTWARSLAGVTGQIAENDPEVRALLQRGPGFAAEVSDLLNQVKPTLPILLANLTTVGQILVTYNPSLEQLLVLFPAVISAQQAFGLPKNNPTGLPSGDFALTVTDPPPCTVGFLPPSQWRNPADETVVDTPDGLYCKLPQDSPISVRGARNYPCMAHPGKRAPTVELCNDPKGYQPLAMRQHYVGPYPIDPNLIKQGVPLDDRVDYQERIYAPIQGTPLPPGAVPSGTPPGLPPGQPLQPAPFMPPGMPPPSDQAPFAVSGGPVAASAPVAPPPPPGNSINGTPIPAPPPAESAPDAVPAQPSSFGGNDSRAPSGPTVAYTPYDPGTGQYLTADGQLQQQTNMAIGAAPKSWQDLMPT
ncbi:mammalian cell entry protein [Mycolicibacterium moriokaense]|uniref:Mammalian cell entry protein n=1 Tax=Mycolicibacterium moriokaense TaxID=39691 RepID=A0AAD1H9U7_9MYCO|nr:MlaD family protein [Mycolicibacterium moriokaense]MCV7041731.1 MCE family protein [Mycolicibacterium moriokaense]ORB21855.1 mammalian cell entry protein [Mycolicibacterium moriokaense]BBX01483.1 mammalian cell entry protein [Mycolicibacterium moriokaense]